MFENVVYRKRSGMYVRPNTSDDLVIDEAVDYSGLFLGSSDVDYFMDIGANIGSVIQYAIKNTPLMENKIIGYEPDFENYKMLKLNCYPYAFLYNKAISDKTESILLYVPKGSNKGKISTIKRNDTDEEYTIKSLSFSGELKKYRPSLIKMDIEGGEYNINLTDLPNHITGFAIEIHKINNNWKKMKKLYQILHKQFSYELGDIPTNDNWYKQQDCFMTIFLRNKK